MTLWTTALREGAVAGTVAALLSSAVLAVAGRRHSGSAVAPMNAVSHWLWGDESLRQDAPSWRYTVTGFFTNHAAAVMWAVLYSRLYGHRDEAKALPQALAGGVATSAVACLIDYRVVPKRLTPGFEHRVSTGAMVATYSALALGFAAGAMLLQARRR